MIPCELNITSTPFRDTKILTYEIEFPLSGKKFGFNLLGDEYFTILYIIDTIPNSPAGNQLLTRAKQNMWIIAINREEPITDQGALDELNHQKQVRGKSKFKISL